MDLKCGVDKDGEPLRWKRVDVERGYIVSNGKKYRFTAALKQKATLKIDVARLINNVFVMITEKYFINIESKNIRNYLNQDTHKSIILHDLEKDFYDYFSVERNYFKALKRAFSWFVLQVEEAH